jgi:hypothetical protein
MTRFNVFLSLPISEIGKLTFAEAITIIIGLLGVTIAFLAAKYDRNAWLHPVPSLKMEHAKAKILKVSESRFLCHITMDITNISSVPALIEKILINGLELRHEVIEIEKPDTTNYAVGETAKRSGNKLKLFSGFRPLLVQPGYILKPDEKRQSMDAKIFFTTRPTIIRIKIYTPKRRPFKIVIKEVKEDSLDSVLDFM